MVSKKIINGIDIRYFSGMRKNMSNENEVGNLGTNDEIYFQNRTSFSTRSFTFDVAYQTQEVFRWFIGKECTYDIFAKHIHVKQR